MPACSNVRRACGRGIAAEPAAQNVARRTFRASGATAARDVGAGHDRGGRVDQQNGVGLRFGRNRLDGVNVAFDRRIADDVDRIRVRPRGRQHGVEAFDGRRRKIGERPPAATSASAAMTAGTAAVGDDRQPIAGLRPRTGQRLDACEQILRRRTRSMPARRIAAS